MQKTAEVVCNQPNSATKIHNVSRELSSEVLLNLPVKIMAEANEEGVGKGQANPFQKQLTQLTNKYVKQLQNSEIDDDSAENKASDPSQIFANK